MVDLVLDDCYYFGTRLVGLILKGSQRSRLDLLICTWIQILWGKLIDICSQRVLHHRTFTSRRVASRRGLVLGGTAHSDAAIRSLWLNPLARSVCSREIDFWQLSWHGDWRRIESTEGKGLRKNLKTWLLRRGFSSSCLSMSDNGHYFWADSNLII